MDAKRTTMDGTELRVYDTQDGEVVHIRTEDPDRWSSWVELDHEGALWVREQLDRWTRPGVIRE